MCPRSIRRSRTYPPKSEIDHFARPIGSIGLSSETPRGFAITNLRAADEGELSIWSTDLLGSEEPLAAPEGEYYTWILERQTGNVVAGMAPDVPQVHQTITYVPTEDR